MEEEQESLVTHIETLQKSSLEHEACPSRIDFLSLQQEHLRLVEFQELQMSQIQELEREVEDYTSIIQSLQETSSELQSQAEVASEQLRDVNKDLELKDKHIQSLEGIIERLELNLEHPEAVRLEVQSAGTDQKLLSEEVRRLSNTLNKVKSEYSRLEKVVNQNENLSKEAQIELKKKEAELENCRRRSEAEIGRLKALIEQLETENQKFKEEYA